MGIIKKSQNNTVGSNGNEMISLLNDQLIITIEHVLKTISFLTILISSVY